MPRRTGEVDAIIVMQSMKRIPDTPVLWHVNRSISLSAYRGVSGEFAMSILGTLFSKIFPSNHPAIAAAQNAGQTAAGSAPASTPTAQAPASNPAMPPVDVNAVLTGMAQKNPEKLNWQTSIVDLMKLVGMDSSLTARKELAKELGYTGNTDDSATMNVWLHSQVLAKIAANGGTLPAGMQH